MKSNNKIIFIVGNSRSGTTMLGSIFGKHSDVYRFEELHFFDGLVSDIDLVNVEYSQENGLHLLRRLLTRSRDGIFASLDNSKYSRESVEILESASSSRPIDLYNAFLNFELYRLGKSIPCKQSPRYIYSASEILSEFPNAYIINLIRDPRDVLLSQKNRWRRLFISSWYLPKIESLRLWINYHPYVMSKLWAASVSHSLKYSNNPRFTTIKFEELLSNPEATIRRLCDFVCISYQADMLNVPKVGSSINPDSPRSIGIDSSRSCRWGVDGGLTNTEITICQNVCSNLMCKFDYKCVPVENDNYRLLLTMFMFPVKLIFALFLNFSRTKNIISYVNKRWNN